VLLATASQSTNRRYFPKTVRHAVTTAGHNAVAPVKAASAVRFKAAAAIKETAATPRPGSKKYVRKKECA
jgi:hypothetical protein